jgi:type I restriction enzyme S subunit
MPLEYAYCLARSAEFRDFAIQSMTGSSGRQRVQVDALSHFIMISPSEKIAELFGKLVKPLFTRAKGASDESRILAGVRDALLPKLLSGEISVNNQRTYCRPYYEQ